MPQNSYLADVKIVAVKVGGADYKTTDNATAAVPTLAALLADTENVIGSFNTQTDAETGMNHIENPLWLSLHKVNGEDAGTLAAANDQVGGSTFRSELRTGECTLGENFAIAVVPVIEPFGGKLLGDHETVVAPETAYASNLSVEKTITSATDSTLIDGAEDTVYVNYKTLFDTAAYGADTAGDITLKYQAPDADGAINNGAAVSKQVKLGANSMAQFNSVAVDTEADAAFFDPAKLLPGTAVTVSINLWRDGAAAGVQNADADDPDVFDSVSFTWTVSEEDYYKLFLDDTVVFRSSDAAEDHTNVLGYALPGTIDFANVTFYTNHAASTTKADAAWSVKNEFNVLKAYAGTWHDLAGETVDTKTAVSAAAGDGFCLKAASHTGGGGGGSVAAQYPVTVSSAAHGSVKADKSTAFAGATVTFTVTPEDGYQLKNIVVTDANGKEISVSKSGSSRTITMPNSAVTVKATFSKVRLSAEETGVADWLICDVHGAYISGYTDGTVKPQGNITRAEVAMIFYRLLKNKDVTITASFADVPNGAWYAEAVNALANIGVIKGVDGDTFEPARSITRAEFATIATRLANTAEGKAEFTDVPETYWAYGNIATAAAYGWVDGYADGTFVPTGNITRAEVAAIVNRMIGRTADEAHVHANPDKIEQFTDLQDASKWYYFDVVEASNAHDFTKEDGAETWN
ncbi:MAG: S-layer homology domain-containing protein [Oscillospiraceae bacterium]|nr:S-layer homology domain-containing protein [Oscillospiraceae bacterium]